MPELPIHPGGGQAPGYALERRLRKLREASEESYAGALEELRLECVFETLRLTGSPVEREVVGRIVSRAGASGEREPGAGPEVIVHGQVAALSAIERRAANAPVLALGLVQEVHRLANPSYDGSFRTHEIKAQFGTARPSPPRFVEGKVKNLLNWLSAESVRAMFPAERMALWFARFVEIGPFPRGNFRTAHLLTNFFSRSEGYPPITLRFDDAEDIRSDVERAIAFQTEPLVMRFSEALSGSLRVCEEAAGISE